MVPETSEEKSVPVAAPENKTLELTLLATGIVFLWLLAFQGLKGSLTPYRFGEHALAMLMMEAKAFPYHDFFVHTEGHVYLFTALPFFKFTQSMDWGLWGLLLYPRLMLSAAAILLYLCIKQSGAGVWTRRLGPLVFIANPYTLELARTFDGMADVVFYTLLMGYGLLSGKGHWLMVGAVAGIACRGLMLPHAIGLTALFLVVHPKEARRVFATFILMVLLIFVPVWATNFSSWKSFVVDFHLQWIVAQSDRILNLQFAAIGGIPAIACWLFALKKMTGGKLNGNLESKRNLLTGMIFLFPILLTVSFLSGILVRDQYFAPTLLFMVLVNLLSVKLIIPSTEEKGVPSSQLAPLALALVVTLATTAWWQADRWPRGRSITALHSAFNKEKPGKTIHGDKDILAQLLFERKDLKLWMGYPQSDTRLVMTGVVHFGSYITLLNRSKPDYILVDQQEVLGVLVPDPVKQLVKKKYKTFAKNKRGTFVVYGLPTY